MKKIISNQYIFAILTKIVIVVLGILSSVFINRYLGPSLKGEYSYLLNIINMFVLVLNLGIYQSYPYFRRIMDEDIKNKFFSIFVLQFTLYIILGVIVNFIFQNSSISIAVLLIPLMIFSKQLNFIALVENVNFRNKLNVGNQIFYFTLLAISYFLLPVNLMFIFLVLFIKDIVMVARIIQIFRLKVSFDKADWKLTKESIKYGFYPMLSVLLLTMNYSLDTIILKGFVDYNQIGLYSVGVTLANQVWLIPDAFKEVLFSKTARSDSISDLILAIKINLYIGIISVIGIIVFGEQLINILYGAVFIDSYIVTTILVAGLIPMIIFKFINTLFIAKGKQKISFNILLVSVIVNIILNYILIPSYGIIGAAGASVFSYTICGISYLLIFSKNYNVELKEILLIDKSEFNRVKKLLKR